MNISLANRHLSDIRHAQRYGHGPMSVAATLARSLCDAAHVQWSTHEWRPMLATPWLAKDGDIVAALEFAWPRIVDRLLEAKECDAAGRIALLTELDEQISSCRSMVKCLMSADAKSRDFGTDMLASKLRLYGATVSDAA